MCKAMDVCGNDCPGKAPEGSPIFYQVHVTVSDSLPYDGYFEFCSKLDMKPLVITNLFSNGSYRREFIATKNVKSILDVIDTLVAADLKFGGLAIRRKTETVPWNPIIEQIRHDKGRNCYFETHWKINRLPVVNWFKGHNLAVSRTDKSIYITNRNKLSFSDHKKVVDECRKIIQDYVVIEDERTEFAVSDSNPDLDREWLESWK